MASTTTNSRKNRASLRAGNIFSDARSGPEIVNYRTMINNTVGSVVVANGGALGESILEGGALSATQDITLRNLVGGTDITLTAFGNSIRIDGDAGGGGSVVGVQSVGGETSLIQGIGTDLLEAAAINLKSLVAGTNITIVESADTLTINSGAGGGIVTSVNAVGGGVSLLQAGASDAGPVVELVSLTAGTNITLTTDDTFPDTIVISAVTSGGGGTLTDVTSVGGGISLLQGGVATSSEPVNLRTLAAGTGIELVETDGSLEIISSVGAGGGTVESVNSLGTGVSLLGESPDVGPVVELKSLVPGENVAFYPADGSGSVLEIVAASAPRSQKLVLSTNEGVVYDHAVSGYQYVTPRTVTSIDQGHLALRDHESFNTTTRITYTLASPTVTTTTAWLSTGGTGGTNDLVFGDASGTFVNVNRDGVNFRVEVKARVYLATFLPQAQFFWLVSMLYAGVNMNTTTGVPVEGGLVDSQVFHEQSTDVAIGGRPHYCLQGTYTFSNAYSLLVDNPDGFFSVKAIRRFRFGAGSIIRPFLSLSQVQNFSQTNLTDIIKAHLSYRIITY